VACYTDVWPRRFLTAMSVWITVTVALHVTLPFGILYTEISGLRQISADVKLAIYRIAQEALNNISKHAGATLVSVTCRALPEGLLLTVRDDGCGFDPAQVSGEHLGLRIMAERASGIGARLCIDSAPRCGTRVEVRWPAEAAVDYNKRGVQIALS